MAIIRCKMCGGELNFSEGVTVAECEYCGSRQTWQSSSPLEFGIVLAEPKA